MPSFRIRPEGSADFAAIRDVTRAAFAGKPYADGDEHELIGTLRDCGALELSLVAEQAGQVIGQITFSPAYPADGSDRWFALGPVAVLPEHQSKGVGAALIHQGLQTLGEAGAAGCVLTGNPAYYRRFGFALAPDQVPVEESADYFMLKPLASNAPGCAIGFHPAFYGNAKTEPTD